VRSNGAVSIATYSAGDAPLRLPYVPILLNVATSRDYAKTIGDRRWIIEIVRRSRQFVRSALGPGAGAHFPSLLIQAEVKCLRWHALVDSGELIER
jgi:hypothetical protein